MPGDSEWFDLWHTHLFLKNVDLLEPPARREGLRALFAAWSPVETAAGRLTCPWQSWLVIDPAEPDQNAIYLHTPNPNCENFPYPFEGVTWGADPPGWLSEFIDSGVELGRSEYGGAELYWVRRV
jgi:hypothetical protein